MSDYPNIQKTLEGACACPKCIVERAREIEEFRAALSQEGSE